MNVWVCYVIIRVLRVYLGSNMHYLLQRQMKRFDHRNVLKSKVRSEDTRVIRAGKSVSGTIISKDVRVISGINMIKDIIG